MERLYRLLLSLYPALHTQEFGNEMADVFCRAYLDAIEKGMPTRVRFLVRELLGAISGAYREHLYSFSHPHLIALFHPRRLVMRTNRRFPVSALIFMLLSLLAVVYAIEQAAVVQAKLSAIRPVDNPLTGGILVIVAIAYVAGIIGWIVAFAFRRAGTQRLSRTETWFSAK